MPDPCRLRGRCFAEFGLQELVPVCCPHVTTALKTRWVRARWTGYSVDNSRRNKR